LQILFIIKGLVGAAGGAERVLCTVANGLASRGFRIAIATLEDAGGPPFYPLSGEVEVVPLGAGQREQPASPRGTLRRIREVRRLYDERLPSAVVAFMHSSYVPAAIGLAGRRVPLVASEHNVYANYSDSIAERWLLRACARRAQAVTVLSEDVRATFPKGVRERMVVVPNPVWVPPTEGGGLARLRKEEVILAVGSLTAQKDHLTLVRAFYGVTQEFPDWRLRIVGEGPLRHQLETEIDHLGLAGLVELPGQTDNVSDEYRRAALLVTPSRYEGFGLVTAEALAHGVPAIGFDDGPGTSEIIHHGENGLLVSGRHDRAAALSDGLRLMLSDPELRQRLASGGPRSIRQYRTPCVLDRWEALLMSVSE
jgi:GalNAc-alpha-(1->4)-GalNAc-alpha-(1->3)-diNAcBac-PP-undecaprenol alpha-1,4-N-acetyl-D-galactosaminyltransferase